jgi:hypothetical protein
MMVEGLKATRRRLRDISHETSTLISCPERFISTTKIFQLPHVLMYKVGTYQKLALAESTKDRSDRFFRKNSALYVLASPNPSRHRPPMCLPSLILTDPHPPPKIHVGTQMVAQAAEGMPATPASWCHRKFVIKVVAGSRQTKDICRNV